MGFNSGFKGLICRLPFFAEVYQAGGEVNTHLHLEPRLRMSGAIAYTSSPPVHLHGVHKENLAFILYEYILFYYFFNTRRYLVSGQ